MLSKVLLAVASLCTIALIAVSRKVKLVSSVKWDLGRTGDFCPSATSQNGIKSELSSEVSEGDRGTGNRAPVLSETEVCSLLFRDFPAINDIPRSAWGLHMFANVCNNCAVPRPSPKPRVSHRTRTSGIQGVLSAI
jgi:hypothetical protein